MDGWRIGLFIFGSVKVSGIPQCVCCGATRLMVNDVGGIISADHLHALGLCDAAFCFFMGCLNEDLILVVSGLWIFTMVEPCLRPVPLGVAIVVAFAAFLQTYLQCELLGKPA